MTLFVLLCVIGTMAATLGSLLRMVLGPTTLDRLLAFDGVVICTVSMLVLFSIQWETMMFVELIVVIASLGFLTTVAFYYYLSRQQPEEHDPTIRQKPSAGRRS
jgi:multisubunit Na+/H+ antiporter MnhF subunit